MRRLRVVERAAGADNVDAVLLLGALAWLIALQIGLAIAGDGPMGPVLFLGGITVLVVAAVGVTIVPRRHRWRGDVRPRNTVRPRFEPNRPLSPAKIAVEARWGVTELLEDGSWVREVGELSWRRASAYLVGDKTGLVLDPWFLSRRAYVFDETCHVGPSPTPAGLNPGLNLRRKNGVLRISQGTLVIDLAVPTKPLPVVARLGTSATAGELEAISAAVGIAVSEKRLARIARADRRAARRHAFFAGIDALSKANRRVAAACSFFYVVLAVGCFMLGVHLGQFGAEVALLSVASLARAGVYGGRVILPRTPEPSLDED